MVRVDTTVDDRRGLPRADVPGLRRRPAEQRHDRRVGVRRPARVLPRHGALPAAGPADRRRPRDLRIASQRHAHGPPEPARERLRRGAHRRHRRRPPAARGLLHHRRRAPQARPRRAGRRRGRRGARRRRRPGPEFRQGRRRPAQRRAPGFGLPPRRVDLGLRVRGPLRRLRPVPGRAARVRAPAVLRHRDDEIRRRRVFGVAHDRRVPQGRVRRGRGPRGLRRRSFGRRRLRAPRARSPSTTAARASSSRP